MHLHNVFEREKEREKTKTAREKCDKKVGPMVNLLISRDLRNANLKK